MILTLADQEAAKQVDHAMKIKEATEKRKEMLLAAKNGRPTLGSAPIIPEPLEKKALSIHGGDNLMHKLGTTRAFVFRTTMTVNINEMKHDFSDEFLNVHPMRIYPEDYQEKPGNPSPQEIAGFSVQSRKRSFEEFKAPKSKEEILKSVVSDMFNSSWTMDTFVDESVDSELGDENAASSHSSTPKRGRGSPSAPPIVSETKRVRAPWPASAVKSLPRSRPSPAALSYYITMHPQRGRFLPNMAKSLGVTPGPDFGKLTEGQSITTQSGRVVHPEECMEPPKPGKRIVVLDIPDSRYIVPVLSRPELEEHPGVTVFWILGEGVAADERILGRIRRWSEGHHIISSPELCPNDITFQGAAKAATRLNMLHEDHFPLPYHQTIPRFSLPENTPAIIAKPQQLFEINPNFVASQLPIEMVVNGSFDFEGVRAAVEPEYLRLCEIAKREVQRDEDNLPHHLDQLLGKDVEIITLGTGSAQPSKYRNVSATLVRIPCVGSILFDCGEDTIGQLSRLYNPEELHKVLRDLKCIYISHLHADHHLGTTAVLKAWYKARHNCVPASSESNSGPMDKDVDMLGVSPEPLQSDRMWVVALGKYDTWLREYANVEDFGYSRVALVATEEIRQGEGPTLAYLPELYKTLKLQDIKVANALHCLGATTCAFTFQDGFKFAYSGDTRPTRDFVEIGQGATVLLHEATFDDELIEEAEAKKHSTTAEALSTGLRMGAKRLVLTHFSQRYPKLPVLSEEAEGKDMKVALAFDLMRMKVGEIGRFERFIPALRELYKDVDDEALEAAETVVPVDGEKKEKNKKGDNKKAERRERRSALRSGKQPPEEEVPKAPLAILPKEEDISVQTGKAVSS